MKQLFTRTALVCGLLATAVSAQAQQQVTVRAMLGGNQENPPVSAGAHGNATVTVDRATQQVDYEVNIFNLPTGIVGAHIHVGTAGVNGPIIINLSGVAVGQSGAFQLKGTARASELMVRAEQGIRSFDEAAFAIASGAAYVNVHTQANPGGEIRGQLCPGPNGNPFNGVVLCTLVPPGASPR